MTIAEEYAVFGLAAPQGNEPKFHVELVIFITGQGWEIYHPKHKKTTGSKTAWARVLTVAFNRLSLSTWHRTVFAGLRVVADGNHLYRFGSQMWTMGNRSQRHFGVRAIQPLPQRPVLDLPEEPQANEDRGADLYALSDDEDEDGGAGAGFDPRDELLSDDEDDGRGAALLSDDEDDGLGAALLSDDEDDGLGAALLSDDEDDGSGAALVSDDEDDEDNGRGIVSGLDVRRTELNEALRRAELNEALRRTELNEAIRRATELNLADVMDLLKTAISSFHEHSQLAGQAKLTEILSNRDADADAAELFVKNYQDKMMKFKADCVINTLSLLEGRVKVVLSS
ncbi:hypothetical protein FN846DRAFT_894830 [Sphaerosporella brunnea]|uniref:Uncharacterized protein n=1 Tax=Sphaerosporella brunnea TaxID=1250544 RepID=A0A5J5EG78_9PEZI|nr:hypothetical protein FN846DRAFT_894830 [Sphaerosporella brunnea]